MQGRARRRQNGRADYLLRIRVSESAQPVALALIEAEAEHLAPDHGLEQAKVYCRRLNVPFVFSCNGHLFVEFDNFTGLTSQPKPLHDFPDPSSLRTRYEVGQGFSLDSEAAKPLLTRYAGGEGTRRYYQDAAIRAVFEKLARGEKRALLSLATGAGKTFIAVNLLRRIADAGQLRRALFVCDRDELRAQALGALQNASAPMPRRCPAAIPNPMPASWWRPTRLWASSAKATQPFSPPIIPRTTSATSLSTSAIARRGVRGPRC